MRVLIYLIKENYVFGILQEVVFFNEFDEEFDEELQPFRLIALPQWEEIAKDKPESSKQKQYEIKPCKSNERDNKEKKLVCSFYVSPNKKKVYHLWCCARSLSNQDNDPSTAMEVEKEEEIKATPKCF